MTKNKNSKISVSSNSRRKFLEKVGLGSFIMGAAGYESLASNTEQLHPKKTFFWDPYDFGAKGDGKALDTKAIQTAIDKCNEAGGGKVFLHGGCFISGTLYLKNNVTLYIEAGTVLRASNNLDDFPILPSKYPSFTGELVTHKMLIYAEDKKNISICGRGMIDGNGDHWIDGPYFLPSFSVRPRIMHFRGCENIQIRDVTLYNSASWVLVPQSCRNILIDGVYVNSRENPDIEKPRFADAPGRNCDGFDILDCQVVRISNCFIVSGDDAIVLKSNSPDERCGDITITNCIISSNASGIKFGSDTAGAFEDINISNCVIYDTRGYSIGIMTLDGARLERINVSNITFRNIKGTPIYIRLGNRGATYRENARVKKGILKNVIIENIQGTTLSSGYGCFIIGLADRPVENIVIRNINLKFEGEGNINNSYRMIPYREEDPAFEELTGYGFFISHAKNIIIDNIQMNFDRKDKLLPLLCDNAEKLEIRRLKTSLSLQVPDLIRLVDTRDVVISGCRPTIPLPVFLSVYGKSDDIILLNNVLKNAKQKVVFEKKSMQSILTEFGTIE